LVGFHVVFGVAVDADALELVAQRLRVGDRM
jgi:hypothetical protein